MTLLRAPLPAGLEPAEAYSRLRALPGAMLLESTERRGDAAGHSFVVADPVVLVTARSGVTELSWRDGHTEERPEVPLAVLAELMESFQVAEAEVPSDVPFPGGAAGWFSYELGRTLELLPAPRSDDLAMPLLRVGLYDVVLTWSHGEGEAFLVSTGLRREAGAGGDVAAARRNRFLKVLKGPPASTIQTPRAPDARAPTPGFELDSPGVPPTFPVPGLEAVRSTFSPERYRASVQRIRELILRGDIFQANLSQRFQLPWRGDPLELHRTLAGRHGSPFAALIEDEGGAVVSASPERFLQVRGGRVQSRPIKGTAPRSPDPEKDRALAQALEASAKDRAENVMIVDLLRNDLSRVCSPGSVRVTKLCALESHPTVHHLVSVVEGQLAQGRSSVDLLEAAFPGGSITGAPKLRAMEILLELEPTARGVYTGSVGWLGLQGDMDVSIAIRTIRLQGGTAYVQAGGGVVLDSDPELEWRESVDKVRGLLEGLGATHSDSSDPVRPGAGSPPSEARKGAGPPSLAASSPPAAASLMADHLGLGDVPGQASAGNVGADQSSPVVLLDHSDSFVHVLARYVRELGRRTRVLRANGISLTELRELEPSHLILSPGPCTPLEAGISAEAVRAFRGRVPILGVCLGHLCVSYALGGGWSGALHPLHGRASTIRHDGAGIFQGIPDPFQGARYHSLALRDQDLPDGLRIAARAEDGEIMAVADDEGFVWGVQFHPESVLTEGGHRLLANFLALDGGPDPEVES